jgi:excinuclease ABC subunit B
MPTGNLFKLHAHYKPAGDQPQAITALVRGLQSEERFQTLEGVTGSGKTFTIANVIALLSKPAIVISHNKTLAAQLFHELKCLFPDNAVEYFVSYYDYYQPEAYIPQTDTYIEKDAAINEEIERLRLSATNSLLNRNDVIIVASVSCIYGLGSPEDYRGMLVSVKKGERIDRDALMRRLVEIQYARNDYEPMYGNFRARGDTLDIFPSYSNAGIRLEFFGDLLEKISNFDPVKGATRGELNTITISPAKHFVLPQNRIEAAIQRIEDELKERIAQLEADKKLLEAQRLKMRTMYDLEMLRMTGYCAGIENYSRHLSGRAAGEPPATLLDYFPEKFLTIIDESHATIPQLRGMYNGDQSRKNVLVDFGFRLPSAKDNRPLNFEEFLAKTNEIIFMTATPGPYEREVSPVAIQQIIRPTGLVDPRVSVRPLKGQIDDLMGEIQKCAAKKERVLVTTLTKKTAEDLSSYLQEAGLRVTYLHSDIDAIERVEILRALRLGEFDCLIGINLLREGLDLPEVSLVAILEADKEGFLRSETALIQTAGRAARHIAGSVILYADETTGSMQRALAVMEERRRRQEEYNLANHITPRSIKKNIQESLGQREESKKIGRIVFGKSDEEYDYRVAMADIEREMFAAADALEFERAAVLRDQLFELRASVAKGKKIMKKQ